MEPNNSYFQSLLINVTSSNNQTRTESQSTLLNMSNVIFTSKLLDLIRFSINTNAKIIALIVLKNKLSQDNFMEENDCKAFITAFCQIYLTFNEESIIQKSQYCIGLLAIKQIHLIQDILTTGFQNVSLNSQDFHKLLRIQAAVTTALNNEPIRHQLSKSITRMYSNLIKLLKQYYLQLQLKNILPATEALHDFCCKRITLSFQQLFQFMMFADRMTRVDLSKNDLVIREWCDLFDTNFFNIMKIVQDDCLRLFKHMHDNVELVKLYEQQTLTIWLKLFNKLIQNILQNDFLQHQSNDWKQLITNQATFKTIFQILLNAFKFSDDSNIQLRNVCNETIKIIINYTEDDLIEKYLLTQLQALKTVDLSDQQTSKSTYLYIVSNVIDDIDFSEILKQVLTQIQQFPTKRLLISCLNFLKSLISSGKQAVSDLIQVIHPILLNLLQKNNSQQIRQQIFQVMISYLHRSLPLDQLTQILNQIFKHVQTSQNQQQIVSILEDLTAKCDFDDLRHIVHTKILSHITTNLQVFLNPPSNLIHMVSKFLIILNDTITNKVDSSLTIYQSLFYTYVSSNQVLTDQILKLIWRLLAKAQSKNIIENNNWLISQTLINTLYKLLDNQSIIFNLIPILIELAVYHPQTIQKFCLRILQLNYDMNFETSIIALIHFVSILRGTQTNSSLIQTTIDRLKFNSDQQVTIFLIKLILKKGSKQLALKCPIQVRYGSISKMNLHFLNVVTKYFQISSNNEMDKLQQALSGLAIQQQNNIRKSKTSIGVFSFSYLYRKSFCNYNFMRHSMKILEILKKQT